MFGIDKLIEKCKKGEDTVSISSTNNERGIETNEQENKDTGEQSYNINRVGDYNNSTNNTSWSSNKFNFRTKRISNKSKTSK